ncbi:MAG: hypothetical protein C5B53_04715 [Candidatus Melainabacteria bacterium]|nr:MAG: hypothetical protein C5B53_04715 [Candidatus Melainabacteria bacterium]
MKYMRRVFCLIAGLLAISMFFTAESTAKDATTKQTANLAGEYKCDAVHGRLNLIQRTDKRFEFDLDAMWIGDVTVGNVNTGNAHGVIEVQDDTAVYKDPEGPYTLTFKFSRNKVDIKYDGSGFGQWKVTPSGRYKRVCEPK